MAPIGREGAHENRHWPLAEGVVGDDHLYR
jgi:hypothetical protein